MVVTRFIGALVRGLCVLLLIAAPALVAPHIALVSSELVVLAALLAAGFVLCEYAAAAPALLSFCHAGPLNRLRFATLLTMVLLLSRLFRSPGQAGQIGWMAELAADLLNFSLSPIGLFRPLLSPELAPSETRLILSGLALCYLVSLMAIAMTAVLLSLTSWPRGQISRNLWLNLPVFLADPRQNLPRQIERAGAVNIVLGVAVPFLLPVLLRLLGVRLTALEAGAPLMLVWSLALWCFVPATIVLRGIGLIRLGQTLGGARQSEARQMEEGPGKLTITV